MPSLLSIIFIIFAIDDENENETSQQEKPDEPTNPEPKHTLPLTNVCDDPDVNVDASFVDELQALFDRHQTSKLFTPYMSQLRSIHKKSRNNLKRRIEQKLKVILFLAFP